MEPVPRRPVGRQVLTQVGDQLAPVDGGVRRRPGAGVGVLDDALAGRPSDLVLGADDRNEMVPELTRNQFFWPGAIAFDGTYLWVGEFKFSGRLLRFSPSG